jgi:acid phosphatase
MLLSCLALLLGAGAPPAQARTPPPRPAHVIVVIEENRTYAQIIGNPEAPYINSLARAGANFTNAHGVTHPSAPNYYAMFAGKTNTNGDHCPETGVGTADPNVGTELLAAHFTYAAYSGSLPSPGFTGCWAGAYARKHAPWAHFTNLPPTLHQPYSAFPPPDALPTVSFVVPNVDDDMHDGTIKQGDDWLKAHLGPYVRAAGANKTLIILTWDEGYDKSNSIPTIFYGPMVKPGTYREPMNAYAILRTIEDLYGLAPLGKSAQARAPLDALR